MEARTTKQTPKCWYRMAACCPTSSAAYGCFAAFSLPTADHLKTNPKGKYRKKHILTQIAVITARNYIKISITELAKNKSSHLSERVSPQKMLIMGKITGLFNFWCPYFNKALVVCCEPRHWFYDCKSMLAECAYCKHKHDLHPLVHQSKPRLWLINCG